MYKIFTENIRCARSRVPVSVLRSMKLTFMLLFVCFLQLSANSYGQKVALSIKNGSLEEVFSQLRQQTGYNFLYDTDVIAGSKKVTLTINQISLPEMLQKILDDQSLTYTINDKNVVIMRRTASGPIKAELRFSIAGVVTDGKGNVLPGVSILLKGSKTGTTTNNDGKYVLDVPNNEGVLTFSYVGFEKQEVSINGRSNINVSLLEQASLNDVVVIGYGTQRKKDVTGSVSSIKSADLDLSTSANFAQGLQGKAAGVQVIQSTGQPGASVSIQIRSNPSNANPGTLYVIDGVVVNNNAGTPSAAKYGSTGLSQSPLNFINPNDIESIEILKDASARAIYGAQAGGGVVLITTKKGKTEKPTVQYDGSYAAQSVDRMYKVLGTKTYMEQRNLLAQEMYLQKNKIAPYYGTKDINSIIPFSPIFSQDQINTSTIYPNAMDAITQAGYTQQHNLSVAASTGKTNYYISGNYFDQKGMVMGTNYKRWNGRVNLDQRIGEKIKVGINLLGSNSASNNAVTGGQFENGGIITAAMYYPANMPLQMPDGSYPLNPSYSNIPNPLSFTTITDDLKNQRILSSAFGQWEIVKGLVAKANLSYDQGTAKRYNFLPTTFSYGAQVNGIASLSNNNFNTKQIDYTANYRVPLASKHSLDLLAGYTYQLQNSEQMISGNQNFISDILGYYNLAAGQGLKPTVGSSQSEVTYASYFARAIYQFNNKYTLQASVRRDGSSRFAENHKWGYFPGVSAGWNISDENFLKNNDKINLLKLRVGYGEIGNANFPASAFEVYGLRVSPNFGSNSTSTGIFLTQSANPNLKWETAAELNAGLDFSFFKDRLSGSFDYFDKTIRDLISYVPFPADFTVGGVYSNAGKTKSTGYEISIQSKNIRSKQVGGFSWFTTINFSHYLSYWKERSPQALATLAKYIDATGKNALFRVFMVITRTGNFLKANLEVLPLQCQG